MIFIQSFKFILAGFINTFFGLSVIYLLLFMEVNNYIANISGYLFGVTISFFLNKRYVFKSGESDFNEVYRFILVFFISYIINIIILYMTIDKLNNYTSQLLAMMGYIIVNFLLNKFFVFSKVKMRSNTAVIIKKSG
jgi:putative flippase GtrA